jgi:iron complex transport system ATP-binding protein
MPEGADPIMPVPVVLLVNVYFIRNGFTILNDVSLHIARGQHWAIIGPNGAGKTSLVSIINGYHWPSEGHAEVLGCKFGSVDLRDMRRHIGECSSEIRNMIHGGESIDKIVISGKFGSIGLYEKPTREDYERADHLLDFFGLSKLKNRAFESLSSGEQQKTILARALMPEPQLLVLDEPCAGLDLRSREELLDSVQKMSVSPDGPTLIFITHHIEEIMPGITHALALRQGRVVAYGSKDDVLTDEVLRTTFGLHIEVKKKANRFWPMVLK